MRTGMAILAVSLALAACGDAKRQQSRSADIAFDTRQETRSGAVGRAEITAIDAALGDAADMPAESAMLTPAPSTSGPTPEERPVAAPEPAAPTPAAPVAPSVS
ncbi:MAG: hypothetical protein ACO1O3_02810 [Sphingobium sp.]